MNTSDLTLQMAYLADHPEHPAGYRGVCWQAGAEDGFSGAFE